MCTVTVRLGEKLLLTMNRDERLDRKAELPPTVRRSGPGGPEWVAPTDGEAGGTWIAANDAGAIACLLNGYAPGDEPVLEPHRGPSRGGIVPEIVSRATGDASAWLRSGFDPSPYASFLLVVVDAVRGEILRWSRGRLESESLRRGWNFVTSSGWNPGEVGAWRRARYEEWLASGETLVVGVPAIHLLEDPERRDYSPWMTRERTGTRSLTQVEVDGGRVAMRYWRREGGGRVDPATPTAEVALLRRGATDRGSHP